MLSNNDYVVLLSFVQHAEVRCLQNLLYMCALCYVYVCVYVHHADFQLLCDIGG